ncbi:patatin-like protein phospholipase domain-containing protein 2-like, partial [Euroglyphus maynei]
KISCTRCLAIHFTLEKEETKNSSNNKYHRHHKHDSNCRECEYRRQIAILDSLPESVVEAIQEACNQVNNGIINWLFRHPPMKLLSILSIPYLLPIDITIALFSKIYEKLPDIQKELKESFMRFISLLRSLLVKIESNRYFYSAKFSCQLAVKEFDYTSEENLTKIRKSSSHSKSLLMKDLQAKQQQQQQQQPSISPKSMINKAISKSFDLKDIDSIKSRKASYAGRSEVNMMNRNKPRRKSMIEMGSHPDLPCERKEILEKCHDRLSNNDGGNFDRMLEITRKNDAVMAYYYTDENNKMKI